MTATEIRTLAERLIDPAATPGEMLDAAQRLFDGLSDVIGFDDDSPREQDVADTWVGGGRAISLREAARCLREYLRSHAYMRGVQAAIAAMRERFPGETVEVLYAGCGPFAPLVLPLAHRWPTGAVRYTLLDIHQASLDAAQQVARWLGVDDRVRGFLCVDAIEHRIDPAARPHVLVTETMLQGLRDETQVALCANLVPQIRPGGVLVPRRIDLLATLMNHGREINPSARKPPPKRVELGPVMSLTHGNAAQRGECFEIDWPERFPADTTPMLRTRIEVFDDIVLGDNDCSLNLPMTLPLPPGDSEGDGERIRFHYEMKPKPGLVAQWRGGRRPVTRPTGSKMNIKPKDVEQGVASLRLPPRFDPEPLMDALERLSGADWQAHPNDQDYNGVWRVLSLRSPSGQEGEVLAATEDPDGYRDTPALLRAPALASVLSRLPGRVTSARLMGLAAGAHIREHSDRGTSIWDGLVRLHVPIRTHDGIDFRVAGERVVMKAGECWYINASFPHSVRNDGPDERVHLVVDCVVDEAMIALFLGLGHPPRPKRAFEDRNLTLDNVAEVIAGLEALRTETAVAMAADLRRQARAAGLGLD
ncbi:MAG: aspartyl/asparaginyl beta-hydroxylase domain-containing protein [Gammaproteobacteria bacterium]